MFPKLVVAGLCALMLTAAPAEAQNAGGISPTGSAAAAMAASRIAQPARPLLRAPPPTRVPTSVAGRNIARSRTATNQSMVAQIRGDAGFLAGFFRGQPLAISRRPPPPRIVPNFITNFTFVNAPFVVNSFASDVDIDLGDGSVARSPEDEAEGETVRDEAPVDPVLSGGIQVNNIESNVNAAIGTGNTAVQQITTTR